MDIQYLSLYLEYLEVEKCLSPNTIEAYNRDLTSLIDFCIEKGATKLQEIKPSHINSFIMSLRENKITPRSIVRKIASMRGFFKWLNANDYLNTNPIQTLEQPKLPKKLPKVII